jgi:hypothetical protein
VVDQPCNHGVGAPCSKNAGHRRRPREGERNVEVHEAEPSELAVPRALSDVPSQGHGESAGGSLRVWRLGGLSMSGLEAYRGDRSGLPAIRSRLALTTLERQTVLRMATVQADGLVQGEKLREIDQLSRDAMAGQALLARWRDTLAAGDPLVGDELRFFSDLARIAKGEIIASAVDGFTRNR